VIEIYGLLAHYGLLLDEDRLEEWVELFTDNANYRVITRENKKLNLPAAVIWCDNKNMIRDRIHSYRNVNEYNLHYDRHVISLPRIKQINDSEYHVQASYSLFQTTLEGTSILFSVGEYEFSLILKEGLLKIKSLEVISDTGAFETLLATPI
jgi:anthranilate 1,2-dioxygenase small subunit